MPRQAQGPETGPADVVWEYFCGDSTGAMGQCCFVPQLPFRSRDGKAKSESYVTEKIGNAFAAGTIPIYYGTEHIFDIFSRQAFIFMNPFHPSEALAQIKHLEQNKTAYHEMMVRPIFANGQRTLEQYKVY